MSAIPYKTALIVGTGAGLSASLTRALTQAGLRVMVAARDIEKLESLCAQTGASAFTVDATDAPQVQRLFNDVESEAGAPEVVVYNASGRLRGAFVELAPAEVERAISVSAFGGFLIAQQAARRMLPKRSGAILFTGASASIKGYAQSAPFAMGKFALRGLAQSLARELSPQGIHVAHFVIDGAIRRAANGRAANGNPGLSEPPGSPDSMLDPDAIAASYLDILRQPRNAWTWELELRPWVEKF